MPLERRNLARFGTLHTHLRGMTNTASNSSNRRVDQHRLAIERAARCRIERSLNDTSGNVCGRPHGNGAENSGLCDQASTEGPACESSRDQAASGRRPNVLPIEVFAGNDLADGLPGSTYRGTYACTDYPVRNLAVWVVRVYRAVANIGVLVPALRKRGEGLGPGDPLFCNQSRRRISKRLVQFAWRTWQKIAGFDRLYSFHCTRHTAVTAVYKMSKDLFLAQRFARHVSPLTTTIYTHPSDEEMASRVMRGLPC